ncbi:MAG: hypothetical protein JXR97_10925 [Planctomycetes bacterium]|nr:hypothetical protein [Planctomycetota bacterium]
MNHAKLLPLLSVCCILLVGGCDTQGISGPGKTTTLGYDLSKLKARDIPGHKSSMPYHLVIAQAGATSPEPALTEYLRKQTKLFRKVSIIPAAPEVRNFASEIEQRNPEELLKRAEAIDGDILLLVGGQIESTNSRTAASLADMTIVGNYVIPSNRLNVSGSALGAMISISNGTLIMTVDANHKLSKLSTSAKKYASEEQLVTKFRQDLLFKLAENFSARLSDAAGIVPLKVELTDEEKAVKPSDKDKKVATVFILSDGFHVSLMIPTKSTTDKAAYVELGLGERNWATGKGWKWMDAILAATTHNEGIAVAEYLAEKGALELIDEKKRAWRMDLTDKEWAGMISSLEEELRLQEVLYDGGDKYKVVKTGKGYNLLHTCHNFAIDPLGKTMKELKAGFPKPTPILEKQLDMKIGEAGTVK